MKHFLLGLLTGALIWSVSCTPSQLQKAQAVKDGAILGCGIVQVSDTARIAELTGVPEDRIILLRELCVTAGKVDKALSGPVGVAGAANGL